MWLVTTFGFFSAVQKPGDDHLTVRARAAADLDALRSRYLPSLSETVSGAGTDYRYRAICSHQAFAEALAAAARDIDYGNFKNAVAAAHGSERAHVYAEVWQALYPIQTGES